MALSLSIDLITRVTPLNFNLFDADAAKTAILIVYWLELIVLTKEDTIFLLQSGLSRKHNWSLQWLSTLLSAILLGSLMAGFLQLTAVGQAKIQAFTRLLGAYQSNFNQSWQFSGYLFLIAVILIWLSLLPGFIIGLLITKMNRMLAFTLVYGSVIVLIILITSSVSFTYFRVSAVAQANILAFLYGLIGYSPAGMQAWPLVVSLLIFALILSGISYLIARNLQVKVPKS
ncbi:hypothetical protein [Lapidilactobacillus dextrinicus]|nr:hypothetical protein [Lapidilactobacillus dextrinicus]